jgi:hypothetical protein
MRIKDLTEAEAEQIRSLREKGNRKLTPDGN